jgi:predicted nucleotide-binding protein
MSRVGRRTAVAPASGRAGQATKAPKKTSRTPYRVFISHSSGDTWVAQVIGEKIGKLGAAVWIDAKDLSGGDFVLQEVLKAVHACDEAVVLVTPVSVSSQWVTVEIGAFLGQRKRVTPLLYHVDHKAISPIQGVKAIDLNDLRRFLTELRRRLGRTREE